MRAQKEREKKKENLVRGIEDGEVAIKNVDSIESLYTQFESFLNSFDKESDDYRRAKYFLEKFSTINHESVQKSLDREENFRRSETALYRFTAPNNESFGVFLKYIKDTIGYDTSPYGDNESKISGRTKEFLERMFYHLHTYVDNFPYTETKDFVVNNVIGGNTDSRIIFSTLARNYYLDLMDKNDYDKILNFLDIQNNLSSDLAQAIFRKEPALRGEFTGSKVQWEDVAERGLLNSDITKLTKLARNESDPFREISTKIGIELEFKVTGTKQTDKGDINAIVEKYGDILYINNEKGGKKIWKDKDVAEIAIGGSKGLAFTRDLQEKIANLVRELERSPHFVAWGSTHIHVDAADGINGENSLFSFDGYNGDGKGFETKKVPLVAGGSVHTYGYILDTQRLFDQVTLLGHLYQSDTEELFESKERRESEGGSIDKTALITQEDLKYYLLSKNPQRYFLILSKALKDDGYSIPALLRLAEIGYKIPYLNDLTLIKHLEKIDGTLENISAIAGLHWSTQERAVEKMPSIESTPENISAIAELHWSTQDRAVEKMPSIESTPENISAIAELWLIAQKRARSKMSTYTKLKYFVKKWF